MSFSRVRSPHSGAPRSKQRGTQRRASYPSGMSSYPVRVVVTDDLRRSRLTVFFRILLAIPHFLWLSLWALVTFLAAVVNWFATLFAGCSPVGLHGFLARFLRYSTQVYAYVLLLADPYPGFSGTPGYPVDLEV